MKNSDKIHIAYALDDNYAEPTCVSMASILVNTTSEVVFHVVSRRLSEENKAKFVLLGEQFKNAKWQFHPFDFDTSGMFTRNHLPIEAYFRIFLPLILSELDRTIYLDGDTVVTGDILELWECDLNNKAAGMVPHLCTGHEKIKEVLYADINLPYCNSGVLLLDLKKFAQIGLHNDLFSKIIEMKNILVKDGRVISNFADQDILNQALVNNSNAVFLPYKYNVILRDTNFTHDEANLGIRTLTDALKNPFIIHYSNLASIWSLSHNLVVNVKPKMISEYYKYKKMTAFYDPVGELKLSKYIELYEQTFSSALLPYNLVRDLFMQEILDLSYNFISEKIKNKKLVYWGAGRLCRSVMNFWGAHGLYPDMIVDRRYDEIPPIYGFEVEPCERVLSNPEEYFVVILTKSPKNYKEIREILLKNNYDDKNIYFAFQPAIDRVEKSLI